MYVIPFSSVFLIFYPYYLTIFHWFISLYPLEFTGITKGNAAVVVLVSWLGLLFCKLPFPMFISPIFVYMLRLRPIAQRSGTPLPLRRAAILRRALHNIWNGCKRLHGRAFHGDVLATGQAFSPTLIQTSRPFRLILHIVYHCWDGAAIALCRI